MPTETIKPAVPFRVLLRRRNSAAPTATVPAAPAAAAANVPTPAQPTSSPVVRTVNEGAAATVQQLEAAFPGDAGFALACLRERRTLMQASTTYIAALKDQGERLMAQAGNGKTSNVGGTENRGAVSPSDRESRSVLLSDLPISNQAGASSMATATAKSVNDQQAERRLAAGIKRGGDKFGHLNEAVIEYQRRGLSRAAATRQAVIDHPDLHMKWIADKREATQRDLSKARHRVGFK